MERDQEVLTHNQIAELLRNIFLDLCNDNDRLELIIQRLAETYKGREISQDDLQSKFEAALRVAGLHPSKSE